MPQTLTSVGIDIGTSTTQLVFSKITVENTASAWTVPTVKIIGKEVVFRSDIHFTPLLTPVVIDAEGLKRIVEKEYRNGNMTPDDVDTGAIIITGETARKENAKEVLKMLSGFAGDFVVATAGPDLEGILAGKGSGAFEYSKEHSATVMNFDIGGGTTNVAVFQNGKLMDTACFDIGGRLIKLRGDGEVYYLSEKAKALINRLDIDIEIGKKASISSLEVFCSAMADTIIEIANTGSQDSIYKLLITDHDFRMTHKIDAAFLSGGVADCVLNDEENFLRYGDIGILLGRAIKKAFEKTSHNVKYGEETIRATVVGAGNHTTDISGSTIHYDLNQLPIKNIPIVHLTTDEEGLNEQQRQNAISDRLGWLVEQSDTPLVALGLRGKRGYGFEAIERLAKDIAVGMKRMTDQNLPLIVVIESDFGKSLGLCLRSILPKDKPVICIDSVSVDNGDYIDIGIPIAGGQVVPVVIKTLLFGY